MKKKLFYAFMFISVTFLSITGCRKDRDEEKSPEVVTTEDDATVDLMFDAVFMEVEEATSFMEDALYGGIRKSAAIDTCKVITVSTPGDTIHWPKTITIDFGDGCTGLNGRVRQGKIIIVVSNPRLSQSFSRTVTFENFSIDGFKVEGIKTITRAGMNNEGNPLLTVSLVNGKVTSPEGKSVTRAFTRTREWTVGYDTPRLRLDDEYLITGTASGTDRNGIQYSREIIDPLHVKNSCLWILSGTVKTTKTGKPEAILDYGDDVCDRIATVTSGEKTFTITLRR